MIADKSIAQKQIAVLFIQQNTSIVLFYYMLLFFNYFIW